MSDIVVVPAVAVCAGAIMAISVPCIALKEALEKRAKKNIKKHLGRRSVCRVHFGDLDVIPTGNNKKLAESQKSQAATFIGCAGKQSLPPAYEDLHKSSPPAYKDLQ